VLSASPKKGGNSDLLCDQFIQGAQAAGHSVEKIFLKEKEINYCTVKIAFPFLAEIFVAKNTKRIIWTAFIHIILLYLLSIC
jgi:hypothetical protein